MNNKDFVEISHEVRFSRRSLKHFIDSRISQGNSWDEMNYLLGKTREVIEAPQLIITNKRSKYPGSVLLGIFYENKQKAVIVILDRKWLEVRDIISVHFKKSSDFYRLMNKKKELDHFADGGSAYPS